jgi:hypothetical protein
MNQSPAASSARQLAAPTTAQHAFSTFSGANGGGQGGQDESPRLPPRFNPPDSYWAQKQYSWNTADLPEPDFSGLLARHLAISAQGKSHLDRFLEASLQDRENDPRSRDQMPVQQIIFRPLPPAPRIELSAEALNAISVFKDPVIADLQLQASTSSTTSAAAAQQDNTACCIPPCCTIL